jgi:hypothetical protein
MGFCWLPQLKRVETGLGSLALFWCLEDQARLQVRERQGGFKRSGKIETTPTPSFDDCCTAHNRTQRRLIAPWGLVNPQEGVIQHSTINNLAFGRNVDEALRVLQALQYVQENPDEVCPAGWKPGDKTMKPDPEGSKEYFAAI